MSGGGSGAGVCWRYGRREPLDVAAEREGVRADERG